MIAGAKGHVNAVTFLIEHGANIDLQNKNGDTALLYAVNGNSFKVLFFPVSCPGDLSAFQHGGFNVSMLFL